MITDVRYFIYQIEVSSLCHYLQ